MGVPLDFWRGVLAVLSLFFAYMLGRSYAGFRTGRVKLTRLYGWVIRTGLCALAIAWRHPVDAMLIVTYALIAAALALGVWQESRPRQEEDLTKEIFPHENDNGRA